MSPFVKQDDGSLVVHRRVVISTSVCAPIGRFVVIHAWFDDALETSQHELVPVHAIESVVADEWSKRVFSYNDEPLYIHPDDFAERGWKYRGRFPALYPVIWTEDFGLIATNDAALGTLDVYEYQHCPWPQEQDEQNLAEMIKEAKQNAKEKYREWVSP